MLQRLVKSALFAGVVFLAGCAGNRSLTSIEPASETPHKRALAFYLDGLNKDMNQNPAAALLSYQEALLYDSTSADIHLAIGKDYLLLDKEELGLRSLNNALRLDPESIEILGFLADVALRKGEIEKAEGYLNRILALDSLDVMALNQLAYVALRQEDIQKAESLMSRLMDNGAKPIPPLVMGLGNYYLNAGKLDKGAALFEQLVNLDPYDGLGYFGQGMFCEVRGDTAAAEGQYRQALTVSPGLGEAVARLSQIFIAQKRYDDGLKLLTETIASDSTDVDAWLGMSVMHKGAGRPDSAKAVLYETARRFPQDPRAPYDLGQYYMEEEAYWQAYKAFDKVTQILPDDASGWLNAGVSALFADSLDAAERCLRKVVPMIPQHFQASFYLGTVLVQKEKNAEALPYLEQALTLSEGSGVQVLVMSTLASAYDAIEDYERADVLFERALALEPENSTILNNYGYSLSERDQRLDEALSMVEKALTQEPENASFLDTIGWILFKTGNHDKALEYIQKSWEVRPESAEVAEHMAEILLVLDRKKEAVQYWKKSLELKPDQPQILEKIKTYE